MLPVGVAYGLIRIIIAAVRRHQQRKKEEAMKAALVRLTRSAIVTGATLWWSMVQNDPKWMALVPVLHGIGKWVRDKYPKNPWVELIPF